MKPISLLLLVAMGLSAGCMSVGERRREDTQVGIQTAEARLGFSVATDDVQGAVESLLASDLDEAAAIKLALLRNPQVRRFYEELGIQSADLMQAGLPNNPVLSANAKFFSGGVEIEGALAQSFLDLFYIPMRKRLAGAELAAGQAHLARNLVHLAFEVKRGLLQVKVAQADLELVRQQAAAQGAAEKLANQLHAAGNLPDKRRTADELAAAQTRQAVAQAEQKVLEARERMSVLMGLFGPQTAWRTATGLPDLTQPQVDLARVEAQAIAVSLNLAESRAMAQAAGERAGLTGWNALLPNASAGLAAKKETSQGDWGLGPAFSIPVPLFSQGQTARAVGEARVRIELAKQAEGAIAIRSAARVLRMRAESLRLREAHARTTLLPLSQRLVRETLRDYNAMQIGAFEVLESKRRDLEARRNHVRLRGGALEAQLDLAELLAGNFDAHRVETGATFDFESSASPASGGH